MEREGVRFPSHVQYHGSQKTLFCQTIVLEILSGDEGDRKECAGQGPNFMKAVNSYYPLLGQGFAKEGDLFQPF